VSEQRPQRSCDSLWLQSCGSFHKVSAKIYFSEQSVAEH
jgi:hypothetical protein